MQTQTPGETGRFVLIANPGAGGRGSRGTRGGAVALADVADTLRAAGRSVETQLTTGPSDAAHHAARAAKQGVDAVVAIGGDGTVHEVLNGLMAVPDERRPQFGVVPTGTGNDFARQLGLVPGDPLDAARVLVRGNTRRVDIGHLDGLPPPGPSHFCVAVGFGLLAAAVGGLKRSRLLPARAAYFIAGLRALLSFRAPELNVTVDGVARQGRFMMVHVGLTRTTGGGYVLTPEAGPNTGHLHVNTVTERGKLEGLLQWPRISAGKRLPGVAIVAGKRVRIDGAPGLSIHVDGEPTTLPNGTVELSVLPAALSVFTAR